MAEHDSTAPTSIVHLRNGGAGGHPQTKGAGATWCGKKLLGEPEHSDDGLDTFTSYGAQVHTTFDPNGGTCEKCRTSFDAAYGAAFPEGLKPIATFRLDSPEDMANAREMLSPEALTRRFEKREGVSVFADVIGRALGQHGA